MHQAEEPGLIEMAAHQLHADRQPLPVNTHRESQTRHPSQIGWQGKDILKIHGQRVIAVTADPEGCGRRHRRRDRVHTIAVTLDDIRPRPDSAAQGVQLSLFDSKPQPSRNIATALDSINARFGRNSVTLGPQMRGRASHIGTSIAFGRIPEAAEFNK